MRSLLAAALAAALLAPGAALAAEGDDAPAGSDGAPAAPPYAVYPGAKASPKLAEDYRDDRGVPQAWGYSVKAEYGQVVEFYKKQIGEATAESESDDLFFASKGGNEVRIEKGKPGWIRIEMGANPSAAEPAAAKASSDGAAGDGQANGAGQTDGAGSDGDRSGRFGKYTAPPSPAPNGDEGSAAASPDGGGDGRTNGAGPAEGPRSGKLGKYTTPPPATGDR